MASELTVKDVKKVWGAMRPKDAHGISVKVVYTDVLRAFNEALGVEAQSEAEEEECDCVYDALVARLTKIDREHSDDPEACHAEFDRALLDFIGDERIKTLYDKSPKWCA